MVSHKFLKLPTLDSYAFAFVHVPAKLIRNLLRWSKFDHEVREQQTSENIKTRYKWL